MPVESVKESQQISKDLFNSITTKTTKKKATQRNSSLTRTGLQAQHTPFTRIGGYIPFTNHLPTSWDIQLLPSVLGGLRRYQS